MKPTRLTMKSSGPATQGGSGNQWPASAQTGGAGQIGLGGSALPDTLRSKMESQFGADFSDVKILNNSCLPKSIWAQAYTSGANIHFSSGAYDPHSAAGQKLLAHELTHVVQQKQGRTGAE
jgi:hypothetical protein